MGKSVQAQVKRKMMRKTYWKLLVFSLFLVYPLVTSNIMKAFACKEIEGANYLVTDFKVSCDTAEYRGNAFFAGIMVLVYPIGIPLFFVTLLFKYRYPINRLGEPGVLGELGFIYSAFDHGYWWFEMVDMFHKSALTLIVFLPSHYQVAVAFAIVGSYTSLILYTKPYIRKGDDRLHLLANATLSSLFLAGWVLNQYNDVPDHIESLVATLMLFLLANFFLNSFLMVSHAAVKILISLYPSQFKKFTNEEKSKDRRLLEEMCATDVHQKFDDDSTDDEVQVGYY